MEACQVKKDGINYCQQDHGVLGRTVVMVSTRWPRIWLSGGNCTGCKSLILYMKWAIITFRSIIVTNMILFDNVIPFSCYYLIFRYLSFWNPSIVCSLSRFRGYLDLLEHVRYSLSNTFDSCLGNGFNMLGFGSEPITKVHFGSSYLTSIE